MTQRSPIYIKDLNPEKLKKLAEYKDLYCVSIYLPKHIESIEAINIISDYLLIAEKNQSIHQIKGLSKESIYGHLTDLKEVLKERDQFVAERSLAIFFSKELTEVFSLDSDINLVNYINNHFYIKHLAVSDKTTNSLKSFKKNTKEKRRISEIKKILLESSKGNVETLLVDKDHDVYGEYDEQNNFVIQNSLNEGTSITNLAIINTIINDGKVQFIESSKNILEAIT